MCMNFHMIFSLFLSRSSFPSYFVMMARTAAKKSVMGVLSLIFRSLMESSFSSLLSLKYFNMMGSEVLSFSFSFGVRSA